MTRKKNAGAALAGAALAGPGSQYLKISRSGKRFMTLMKLAMALDCPWQTIAYEAIDRLLEDESSKYIPHSKPPK